jgi:hypothetical protein
LEREGGLILPQYISFIGKKSDKLRAISLRNGFNLSEIYAPNPPFLSIISYIISTIETRFFFIIEKYCYNCNIFSEDKKKCLSYQEFQNKEDFEDIQGDN